MRVILAFSNAFPFHGIGGIEKYPYYFAKNLLREGIDVEIVTSTDNNKSRIEFYDDIKYVLLKPKIHDRLLTMGAAHPWANLLSLNMARYLKKKDFDILHSYSEEAYFYLHCKKRAPAVVQPFGLEPWTGEEGLNLFQKVYISIFMKYPRRYCIEHADAIISEGEFMNKQTLKLFRVKEEKIFNLPVPIDIEYIRKLKQKNITRKKIGLSERDFVIISVNRFAPIKGLNYLVDAFNVIKQHERNAKLILVGNCTHALEIKTYKQLVDRAKKHGLDGSVIFKQNLPENELFDYYNLSDIYVSPTLQEDFIMSIEEAMACGLPVISTGQEFLVKDGINGYVVSKKNVNELADAVLKICFKNKRYAMGEESQNIAKKYDWVFVVKVAIKQYEKLIDK